MNTFYIIFTRIKFIIWYYIIRPIKKIYHRIFQQAYVPDNERNQAILNYCQKLIIDHNYQPSTPVEHWIDNGWREKYDDIIKKFLQDCEKDSEEEKEKLKTIIPYEEYRPTIASQVLITLSEYSFIKDRD